MLVYGMRHFCMRCLHNASRLLSCLAVGGPNSKLPIKQMPMPVLFSEDLHVASVELLLPSIAYVDFAVTSLAGSV